MQTASAADSLRLLYVTDRRIVLCHMAGSLYPVLQLLLLVVLILVPDGGVWLSIRAAAIPLILAIAVLRGYVRFRRIDQVLPLAEIEAVRPTVGQDPRSMVLWLRGGPAWLLLCPRPLWLVAAPNVVRSFRRTRKTLHELVAGGGAVR